jgi:cytidylate kinase
MNAHVGLEHCLSFINSHTLSPAPTTTATEAAAFPKRAVTISRQSGCGAHIVAERLAKYLQNHSPKGAPPWTAFDRNLVERVLADHHLPEHIKRFMPEDRISQIDDIMDELFGLHPSQWTLVQQTSDTILKLAELGNVIILGRGAHIITAKLNHVTHVRLTGSRERRIENMRQFEGLGKAEASARVEQEDLGRERYVKKYFEKSVDDPLLYHLVINTDKVSLDDAARVIGDLVLSNALVPIR